MDKHPLSDVSIDLFDPSISTGMSVRDHLVGRPGPHNPQRKQNKMNATKVGDSGLQVSTPILGTMGFGTTVSDGDAYKMLDVAYDLGICTVDTANVYGQGKAEKILGIWLKSIDRDDVVLCTKGYGRMDPRPDSLGGSARNIVRSFENSLKELGVDYIDVYYLHHSDPGTPWYETAEALHYLKSAGKLLYVGTSNMAGWEIAHASAANVIGQSGPVIHQMPYNLMNRQAEQEVLPACEYYGIGAIAYSPLGGGALTKHLGFADTGFIDHCRDWGLPAAQVALAWVLTQPAIAGAVIGPRTLAQLYSCNEACNITLTREQLVMLDKMYPPAGRSPGTWSW